jgi:hypothetical protein
VEHPRTNHRTWTFKQMEASLPGPVRALANAAFLAFCKDPTHPGLRHHQLKTTKAGRHLAGSCSVAIGAQYRAIYVPIEDVNVWYWIGSHSAYNNFVGLK